jgi:hypothetical protein
MKHRLLLVVRMDAYQVAVVLGQQPGLLYEQQQWYAGTVHQIRCLLHLRQQELNQTLEVGQCFLPCLPL